MPLFALPKYLLKAAYMYIIIIIDFAINEIVYIHSKSLRYLHKNPTLTVT